MSDLFWQSNKLIPLFAVVQIKVCIKWPLKGGAVENKRSNEEYLACHLSSA